MTEDEQLIRRVATEVMGWKEFHRGTEWGYVLKELETFPTSEDFFMPLALWIPHLNLNDAFLIVEKMREEGWVEVHICQHFSGLWKVTFWHEKGQVANAHHDNLGTAIMLASLKAVKEGK